MADTNFSQFTASASPLATEYAVGYATAVSGGERRWQWSDIRTLILSSGAVTTVAGTAGQVLVNGGTAAASGAITLSLADLGGNPSASVGLTAVNGVATTYMRSDAAPALDVTIAPTWTGIHTFSNATASNSTSSGAVVIPSGGLGVGGAIFAGQYNAGGNTELPVNISYLTTRSAAHGGAGTAYGYYNADTAQSSVTTSYASFISDPRTQATSFTLTNMRHFVAQQGTIGIGSSITTQTGFYAVSSLTGATNNYGFRGNIGAGTGRYNLYMDGTAQNYLAGVTSIGTTPLSTTYLALGASTTSVSSLNVPHGSAPSSPVNGDVWTTTLGMYARINGSTVGPFGSAGSGNVTAAGTLTNNALVIGQGTTAVATTTTGTGVLTALGVNTGTAGAFVVNGGALGTPSSGALTSCTGLPASSLTAAVLAANITLGEGAGQIVLDAALSADGTYSGIIEAGTAGTTLAFGDLVYLQASDSRWELTDADADSTAGAVRIGICVVAAAGDGSATTILLWGKIRADAAFPTLTIGAPAYVSTTAGDIQTAQPSGTDDVIRIVGYGNTADELFFCPSNDYMTHT